jgi:hypothetical protein
MKKRLYFLLFTIMLSVTVSSQSLKQSAGVSVGYGIPFDNSIYMNFDSPDFTIWATPMLNLTGAFIYEYSVTDYLKLGARFEYERINFDSFYTGKTYANRFSAGIQFLCIYPKTPLHAELGGFVQVGRVNSKDFDNPVMGFDNGLLVGPGYLLDNINVALLFQPGFGYYFLSNGEGPTDGLIMYPKATVKISYAF